MIVCPGATLGGLARDLAGDLPLRRVRLQMMQTAPLGEKLTTAIADGDSFRYGWLNEYGHLPKVPRQVTT